MYNSLCQTVLILPVYILHKNNAHILVWGISTFWSEVASTFWLKKSDNKTDKIDRYF